MHCCTAIFSTNKYVPRFKLENHIKELELYNKIKEFFGVGNTLLTTPRVYRANSNPTIVLEINKINELRDILIPLIYDDSNKKERVLLKTLFILKKLYVYFFSFYMFYPSKYFQSCLIENNK